MVSDDVGFLLIFIVLPTILIVSGFWLILFVRRDAQARSAARVNLTSVPGEAGSQVGGSTTVLGPEVPGGVVEAGESTAGPIRVSAGYEPLAAFPPDWQAPSTFDAMTLQTDLEGPADRLSPVVADLLYSDAPPSEPTVSNVRLIELLEEEDRDVMQDVIGVNEPSELSEEELIGPTEDIEPPVEFFEYLGVFLPSPPSDEPAAPLDAGPEPPAGESDPERTEESIGSGSSGDTAKLPEPWELDEEIQTESEADTDARRQRQPDARLAPSSQRARKRGRSAGRRIPKISRSAVRDEDTVERDDRG